MAKGSDGGRVIQNRTFSHAPVTADTWEVLYSINGQPRRFALCTHENDAEVIADALQLMERNRAALAMIYGSPTFRR